MGIFIGQLIGFAVIVFLVVKYIAPPVRKMMAKQQDDIRRQIQESEEAKAKRADAERAHEKAVERAHTEAAKIREDARADAQRISVQLQEQADVEVQRISHHGQEQIGLQRTQLIRQLRADHGSAAVQQAGTRVRDHLADPAAKSQSVDRFLDELEAMAGNGSATTRTEGNS